MRNISRRTMLARRTGLSTPGESALAGQAQPNRRDRRRMMTIRSDTPIDTWYHNDHVTSEYMILSDLSLEDCVGVSFCDHHKDYCKKKQKPCDEKGRSAGDAGAVVLARIIGTGAKEIANLFADCEDPRKLDSAITNALDRMLENIVKSFKKSSTRVLQEKALASVFGATCLALGHGRIKQLRVLAILIGSKKQLEQTFWACVEKFFSGIKIR